VYVSNQQTNLTASCGSPFEFLVRPCVLSVLLFAFAFLSFRFEILLLLLWLFRLLSAFLLKSGGENYLRVFVMFA